MSPPAHKIENFQKMVCVCLILFQKFKKKKIHSVRKDRLQRAAEPVPTGVLALDSRRGTCAAKRREVAEDGWSASQDIAAISMGNHSGSTGNDDGQIVFKTALNAHTDASALGERMRIDSSGRVVVGGSSSYIGGAALAVLGTGTTPNTYGSFAIGKVGANPTANTTLANIRLNGGSIGTRRGAEINAVANGNWTCLLYTSPSPRD